MMKPISTECPTCLAKKGEPCKEPRLPADGVHITRKARAEGLSDPKRVKRIRSKVRVYNTSQKPKWRDSKSAPTAEQAAIFRRWGQPVPKTRIEAAKLLDAGLFDVTSNRKRKHNAGRES